MLLKSGVGEHSWEFLELQRDPTNQFQRKSVLKIHWKDWCWSWSSNTLVTWCEELTHWKRPWSWERLKAGGEGDDKRWDGWMASPTWWTCCSPQGFRVEHDLSSELNWQWHGVCWGRRYLAIERSLNVLSELLTSLQVFSLPFFLPYCAAPCFQLL